MNRRQALAVMSSFIATPAIARPGVSLSLRNVMGESLTLRYHGYLGSAEHDAFSNLARDRRQNVSCRMDAGLIEILNEIVRKSGQGGTFTLLSGYRTRATNDLLPGAAENSFHLRGQALDITRDGMTVVDLGSLAQAHAGGLGLYGDNGFIHLDTGPYRRWGDAEGRLAGFRPDGAPSVIRSSASAASTPLPSLRNITADMIRNPFQF